MQARMRRGWTQRGLAERVGVPYQQIQKYERGEKISLDRLTIVAKALGLKLNSLLSAIAFCIAMAVMMHQHASAGERLECSAERIGPEWHYRTKVPGFNGDVRGDRCWYDGPSMKPRDELYWPGPEMPVQMIPLPAARPRADIEFQDRWEGLWARE